MLGYPRVVGELIVTAATQILPTDTVAPWLASEPGYAPLRAHVMYTVRLLQ